MMKMEREELVSDVEELRKSTQKRAAVTSDTARLSRRPCCTVAVAQKQNTVSVNEKHRWSQRITNQDTDTRLVE